MTNYDTTSPQLGFDALLAYPHPGLAPDSLTRNVIAAYVERELKDKLVTIASRYRKQ